VKEHLNKVAALVEFAVVSTTLCASLSRWDDGLDVPLLKCIENGVGVVAPVGQTLISRDEVNELLGDGRVVTLSGRHDDLEGAAGDVDNCVNLRREASSRAPYFVFFGPPRPPEESW